MVQVKICRMGAKDARAVSKLAQEYFPRAGITEHEVRRRAAHGSIFFVAKAGREVVGFVDVRIKRAYALLSGVAVDKKYESMGIGSRLLRKAFDYARMFGRQHVKLTVKASNYRAVKFYLKHGFGLRSIKRGGGGEVYTFLKGFEN